MLVAPNARNAVVQLKGNAPPDSSNYLYTLCCMSHAIAQEFMFNEVPSDDEDEDEDEPAPAGDDKMEDA